MFLSILLQQSRNLTPSLRTTVQSELVCTKKVFYPILLFPTYLPQASSPLERSKQTEGQRNSSPPETRGPTCRRNSTGLAELWGGWPIELDQLSLISKVLLWC